MNHPTDPNNQHSDAPPNAPGAHPSWCSAHHCTATPERLIGTRGGAHRSEIVPLHLEVTARGATGMLTGQLQQTVLMPGTEVFLLWLIGKEQVGHLRLADAAPLALLIAEGLGALDEEAAAFPG